MSRAWLPPLLGPFWGADDRTGRGRKQLDVSGCSKSALAA